MKTICIMLLLIMISLAATSQTVIIGTQEWMTENVGTTAITPMGQYYSWDQTMDGETTEGSQGVCPDGFHVPTKAEFRTLNAFLGGSLDLNGNTALVGNAGRKLRETGFTHWFTLYTWYGSSTAQKEAWNSGIVGWDTYGFKALGSGMKYGNAMYMHLKTAYFWTSTTDPSLPNEAYFRSIGYSPPYLYEGKTYKTNGSVNVFKMPVRCLKN